MKKLLSIILVMLLFAACSSTQVVAEKTTTAPSTPEIQEKEAPQTTKIVGANKRFQAPPFRRVFTKPMSGTPFQR